MFYVFIQEFQYTFVILALMVSEYSLNYVYLYVKEIKCTSMIYVRYAHLLS